MIPSKYVSVLKMKCLKEWAFLKKKYSPFMEGKLWAIMCPSTTLQKSYKVFMSMTMLDS
jgi:hypothetical protein